ncbi:MAG: PQQ-dependent sugar dehydrogenase [Planctomycetota bacterium]
MPIVVAACTFLPRAEAQTKFPPGFTAESIGSQWEVPVGVAFAGANLIFVAEKSGRVWVVEQGIKSDQPLLDLTMEALNNGDRGLLGIAADPDFATNGFLYLLVVVDPNSDGADGEQEAFSRLVRYTVTQDGEGRYVIDPASRLVLIGDTFATGIPSCHWSHSIGTIRFMSDGSLLG